MSAGGTMKVRLDHDRGELIMVLAATIGEDTARRVVMDAIQVLGIEGAVFSREQAFAALDRIGLHPGLVGITARLAKTRLRAKTMTLPAQRPT